MRGGSARRIAVALVGGGTAIALAAVACGSPYDAGTVALEDAASDAAADVSPDAAAPVDPCAHARPPAMPDVDDAPASELPPFYIAVREMRFASEAAVAGGFDLDGVCTCDARSGTARDGGASCGRADNARCDQPNGVDNVFATLARQASAVTPLDEPPNALIAAGRRTMLLQISKYNGRRNDKEVAIGLALSDGIRRPGCPGSVHNQAKDVWSPGWCGDDEWSLRAQSVVANTGAPLLQTTGYVRDGRLAFEMPTLVLPFTEDATLELGDAVFAGKLTPLAADLAPRDFDAPRSDREQRLFALDDAILGGRFRATTLLAALGAVEQPTENGEPRFLCESSYFPVVRQTICGGRDIARSSRFDFEPNLACDALSAAVSFRAFPVLAGEVRESVTRANPCLAGNDGQPPDSGANDKPYVCD